MFRLSSLVLVCWLSIVPALGFSPLPSGVCHRCSLPDQQGSYLGASSSEEFTRDQVQEMDNLIIELSLEPTDESRRGRLTLLFEEELAKPNGAPKRFADLFDKALVSVGDRVQAEAKKKAMDNPPAPLVDEGEEGEETPARVEKSPEQLQLWALVDMMVQSKTIVKKANGELGSKGTFQ